MTERTIIETADLRKNYDGVAALRGVDLRVPAGSICGFLGRNGAGKTTTMIILLGLAHATSGTARVFDLDATAEESSIAIRRKSAFVSEEKDLYPSMTVGEMIRFTAPFFPRWRADLQDRYLRKFDLTLHAAIKTLSRGGRTKAALLLALCRGAELLVLDEPTSGLDPAMAEEVLQALVSYAANEDVTVFFSSHQIAEVDQIADRVAIIDRGRTVVAGVLDDLRESYRRVQAVFDGEAPVVSLQSSGVVRIARSGRVLTVLASVNADAIAAELRALRPASIDVDPVSLKDIFLETVAVEE